MALNVDLQVLTQPGSTGNQTYSLAANFDPKAIIVWGVPLTADGSLSSYAMGIGLGTYRGSVVQMRHVSMRGTDAQDPSSAKRNMRNASVLEFADEAAGVWSPVMELDLVSMQTGATSNVVLNWQLLHSRASIRVFMLVLGGSDITDALVDDFQVTTAASTQDETVVSGFGKPELMFFSHFSAPLQTTFDDSAIGFGFAKQGEAGRSVFFTQNDADANSVTAMIQRSNRCLVDSTSGGVVTFLGALDTTVANWPTDGFRVAYDATPTEAGQVAYLALRGTFQATAGSNSAPTGGSPPVNQDNDAGFVPKLGLVFGWNLVANTGAVTGEADQAAFGIGATDGSTVAWCGVSEDDGAAASDSTMYQSTGKLIRNYLPDATLQSEADGSFVGNALRLSWGDIDSVAREYQWLALGDAPTEAGEPVYKRFYGPAQLTGSAADLYTVPAGKRARILTIHASNPSGSPVDVTFSIGNDATGTRVYDDFQVEADNVYTTYDPYDLAAGEKLQAWAETAATVVLTVTGYEVDE